VLGLGFEGDYGVYHSAYDDFYWMNHFGDPGYKYHTLMTQLWGVTALRLANADLLPFDFAMYASNIRQFIEDLAKENQSTISGAADTWHKVGEKNCRPSGSGVLCDVTAGDPGAPIPHLDLKPILTTIDEFEAAGKNLNASLTRKLSFAPLDPQLTATLNHGMMQVERNWLNPDGIPGRPWFKHILYGARYTYAHLEIPGLTEAVEKRDWPTAKQQAEILERALHNNTKLLQELNKDLQP